MPHDIYIYPSDDDSDCLYPYSSSPFERKKDPCFACKYTDEFSNDIVSNTSTATNNDERKMLPSTAVVRVVVPSKTIKVCDFYSSSNEESCRSPPLVQLYEETMSNSATSNISSSRSSLQKKRLIINADRASKRRHVATSPLHGTSNDLIVTEQEELVGQEHQEIFKQEVQVTAAFPFEAAIPGLPAEWAAALAEGFAPLYAAFADFSVAMADNTAAMADFSVAMSDNSAAMADNAAAMASFSVASARFSAALKKY